MSDAPALRLLVVGEPGALRDQVAAAAEAAHFEVVMCRAPEAEATLEPESMRGSVVLLRDPEESAFAAALAARERPVLALEARDGVAAETLMRTVTAFAKQLQKRARAFSGAFEGLRVAVITKQWQKAEGLVAALRSAGATVATGEPTGRGLTAPRAIEPHLALIDVEREQESAILARLTQDPVLQWTVALPFEWERLEGDEGEIELKRVKPLLDIWLAAERDLVQRAPKERFGMGLATLGLGRVLRALADLGAPLRLTLEAVGARAQIDLANGLLVGATFWRTVEPKPAFEGPNAVAAALCLDRVRLTSEPYDGSMPANVAIDVGDALKAARLLRGALSDEMPTDAHALGWARLGANPSGDSSATQPSVRVMLGQIQKLIGTPKISADVFIPTRGKPGHADEPTEPNAKGADAANAQESRVDGTSARAEEPTVEVSAKPAKVRDAARDDVDPDTLDERSPSIERGVADEVSREVDVSPRRGASDLSPQRGASDLSPQRGASEVSSRALVAAQPTEVFPRLTRKRGVSPLAIGGGIAVVLLAVLGVVVLAVVKFGGDPGDPAPEDLLVEDPPVTPEDVTAVDPTPDEPLPLIAAPDVEPIPTDPSPVPAPIEATDEAGSDEETEETIPVATPDAPPAPSAPDLEALRPQLRQGLGPSDLDRLRGPHPPSDDATRSRSDALVDEAAPLRRARDFEGAERRLQEAYLIDPDNPHPSAALAEMYLDRDLPRLALPWAETALRLRRRRESYQLLVDRARAGVEGREVTPPTDVPVTDPEPPPDPEPTPEEAPPADPEPEVTP